MSSPLLRDGYHRLFKHLAKSYDSFESKAVVLLDDLVVHSLFGQQTQKKIHRTHTIQNIGLNFQENAMVSTAIYTAFEEKKSQLDPANPTQYTSIIKNLSLNLYQSNLAIKRISPKASWVLDWLVYTFFTLIYLRESRMLLAYSMVIHPNSAVKLTVTRMGQDGDLGFSIIATRNIKFNEPIYELTGAMPGDYETPHSELSAITPHEDHSLPDFASRIFFGLVRFMNHLCQDFNTEIRLPSSSLSWVLNPLISFAVRRILWHSMPMQRKTSKQEKK